MGKNLDFLDIAAECFEACRNGVLISRVSADDKEFHFQNWFKNRLESLKVNFEQGGRNTYPDFSLVKQLEGFELKGLAYPGREANYDSNSQVPTGFHNGRQIYYVFGRYPAKPGGPEYPVIDLIICHGDFLNADHNYVHKNKNIKGFGSYGDIMIRDRKMYVAPTPFGLTEGTTALQTLIVPANQNMDKRFRKVGELKRTEAKELIVGYEFDLENNVITPRMKANPSAGAVHLFSAYRLRNAPRTEVKMKSLDAINIQDLIDED